MNASRSGRGGARRVLLGVVLAALGCRAEPPAASAPSPRPLPPATLLGVEFEGFSGEARDVRVRAVHAEVDSEAQLVRLERVKIEFEDEARGTVVIEAERAALRLDSDDFVLQGRIEGHLGAGEHFETTEVHYEHASERLWTDHPVELRRAGLHLRGDAMEMDLVSDRVHLKGHVEARMTPR
ncbi:MAG: LPS export ABC transporter periplasmic protein LptC [Myxococcota bacterium]